MCGEIQQYKPMVFFPKKVFAYSWPLHLVDNVLN